MRVTLADGSTVTAGQGVVVAVEGPEASRLLGDALQVRMAGTVTVCPGHTLITSYISYVGPACGHPMPMASDNYYICNMLYVGNQLTAHFSCVYGLPCVSACLSQDLHKGHSIEATWTLVRMLGCMLCCTHATVQGSPSKPALGVDPSCIASAACCTPTSMLAARCTNTATVQGSPSKPALKMGTCCLYSKCCMLHACCPAGFTIKACPGHGHMLPLLLRPQSPHTRWYTRQHPVSEWRGQGHCEQHVCALCGVSIVRSLRPDPAVSVHSWWVQAQSGHTLLSVFTIGESKLQAHGHKLNLVILCCQSHCW